MQINTDNLYKKLGPYCLEKCPAKCCHIGKLLVEESFVKKYGLSAEKRDDGYYDLTIQGGCPLLKSNKCSAYADRPTMCAEYPFFIRGNSVVVASSCTAIKQNFFENEFKELQEKGITVVLQ